MKLASCEDLCTHKKQHTFHKKTVTKTRRTFVRKGRAPLTSTKLPDRFRYNTRTNSLHVLQKELGSSPRNACSVVTENDAAYVAKGPSALQGTGKGARASQRLFSSTSLLSMMTRSVQHPRKHGPAIERNGSQGSEVAQQVARSLGSRDAVLFLCIRESRSQMSRILRAQKRLP